MRARTLVALVGLAAATGIHASGCQSTADSPDPSGTETVQAAAGSPDLVLLLASSLRADPPDGPLAGTAFIEGIGGTPTVRYTHAYAQSAATFVSLGSMLVGRYPSAIPMCGLYIKNGQAASPANRAWCAGIPDDRRTLPEVMGLYGYRTALCTRDRSWADPLAGDFHDWIDASSQADLESRCVDWWAGAAGQPRLLVVLAGDPAEGAEEEMGRAIGLGGRALSGVAGEPVEVDAAARDEVYRIYAEAARETGRELGSLLGRLEAAGTRARWTVASSTNGISLVESGGFDGQPVPPFSGGWILDRTTRVPLAIFGPDPGTETRTVDTPVELLDLFPTLARLGGATTPTGLPGADLLTDGAGADGWAYTEYGDMLGVRLGSHMLVVRTQVHDGTTLDPEIDRRLVDPGTAMRSTSYTLSDLASDPYQEVNLRTTDPDTFRAVYQRLLDVRRSSAAVPQEALTPERLWELRMNPSNGYW